MIDLNVNEYVKPDSLREAYDVLISDSKNQIIGGGAWIKMASNKEINTLIDLSNLNLNKITSTDLEFKIGAYVSLHELERFEELNKYYDGIIRQAIKEIMGVGIRNLATVGGSIMGKFSFSDLTVIGRSWNLEVKSAKSTKLFSIKTVGAEAPI